MRTVAKDTSSLVRTVAKDKLFWCGQWLRTQALLVRTVAKDTSSLVRTVAKDPSSFGADSC